MRSRTALCAVLACGAVLAVAAPAAADGKQQRMLHALNVVRAEHGLAPFNGSPPLRHSARAYARWMLRADYFGHLSRIRASGNFPLVGEALAWHSGGRARVHRTVRAWMQSPPHRALIVRPGFRWLGAGMARGRLSGRRATTWVLHFGGR
jgi:uncharacterized protein YkwD